MAGREGRPRKGQGRASAARLLEELEPGEAHGILMALAREDPAVARRAAELARARISAVDVEDVASGVFDELDGIAVEDVWDGSGSKRDGYVDPYELAGEMFEEALEPALDEMRRLLRFSMVDDAKRCCMGILKGVRRFAKESRSEYKDWAEGSPECAFDEVLDEWRKACRDPEAVREVEGFAARECPGWYRRHEKAEARAPGRKPSK
jgi:hypothetical protein